MQYNLNIQRQITPTLTIMLAYAGSRSWHDPLQEDDLNTVVPYNVNGRWIFPNPVGSGCLPGPPDCSQTITNLGFTPTFNSGGTVSNNLGIVPGLLINSNTAQFQSTIFPVQSWYNALQVKVDKKLGHGLLAGGTFSWGKSFDNSSSSFASDNYSNNPSAITPFWDPSITRGLSDFNVTKNVTFNFLYTIPTPASFNGVLKGVASGWGVGANFAAADGIPLWPLIVDETVGMLNGGAYDIPDLVPGCNQVMSGSRSGALQYLNPACYVLPVAPSQAFYNGSGNIKNPGFAGVNPGCDNAARLALDPTTLSSKNSLTCVNLLGNDPRNAVIGPGLINLDFSVTKDTHIRRISETANLQFRAEFFNIANHPNYAFPIANNLASLHNDGTTPAAFGTLTKTQSPERQIQFALKFIY